MAKVSWLNRYLYPQLCLVPEEQAATVLRRAKRLGGRNWKLMLFCVAFALSAYYGAFLAKRFIPPDVLAPVTAFLPFNLNATALVFALLICGGIVIAAWYARRLTRAAILAELELEQRR